MVKTPRPSAAADTGAAAATRASITALAAIEYLNFINFSFNVGKLLVIQRVKNSFTDRVDERYVL